jgi:hypothetical protein
MPPYRPMEVRFWEKVRRGTPEQCWEWTGSRNKGYGQINIHRKACKAHRVAWSLAHGDPGEQHVLHRCDNPPCCNPAHLFLGDQRANVLDMYRKGRGGGQFGPGRTATRRLNPEDVYSIREASRAGASDRSLAKLWGMSRGAILHLRTRRTWGHLP